jgi:hypothetical protein
MSTNKKIIGLDLPVGAQLRPYGGDFTDTFEHMSISK